MNDKTFTYKIGEGLKFKPWHSMHEGNHLPDRRPETESFSSSSKTKTDSFENFPSYRDMAKNLGGSVARNMRGALRGEKLKLSKAEKEKRLDTCRECEHYHSKQDRCKLCGCKMAVKAHLKLESCPAGKW
jgi:hypothetical protein